MPQGASGSKRTFAVSRLLVRTRFRLYVFVVFLGWFALHLAQVLFTLARDLFNFGLGSLHSAQVLFTLARDLFNHHHYQPSHHITST